MERDTLKDGFNALFCFAPTLVDIEEKRCRRFFKGFCLFIRDTLKDLKLINYANLVDRATNKKMRLNEHRTDEIDETNKVDREDLRTRVQTLRRNLIISIKVHMVLQFRETFLLALDEEGGIALSVI